MDDQIVQSSSNPHCRVLGLGEGSGCCLVLRHTPWAVSVAGPQVKGQGWHFEGGWRKWAYSEEGAKAGSLAGATLTYAPQVAHLIDILQCLPLGPRAGKRLLSKAPKHSYKARTLLWWIKMRVLVWCRALQAKFTVRRYGRHPTSTIEWVPTTTAGQRIEKVEQVRKAKCPRGRLRPKKSKLEHRGGDTGAHRQRWKGVAKALGPLGLRGDAALCPTLGSSCGSWGGGTRAGRLGWAPALNGGTLHMCEQ